MDDVTQRFGAQSKDLGGAYFTHAARSFSTTGLEFKDLAKPWGWKMITVHEKMYP